MLLETVTQSDHGGLELHETDPFKGAARQQHEHAIVSVTRIDGNRSVGSR